MEDRNIPSNKKRAMIVMLVTPVPSGHIDRLCLRLELHGDTEGASGIVCSLKLKGGVDSRDLSRAGIHPKSPSTGHLSSGVAQE